jgi:hypothetical protein
MSAQRLTRHMVGRDQSCLTFLIRTRYNSYRSHFVQEYFGIRESGFVQHSFYGGSAP